jgi:RNA polymerase sigma factor (sigma-70 family)
MTKQANSNNDMNTYSSEEILERLKAKDPAMFRHVYKKYAHMVVGHVVKNSGSQEDAKEMLQITFTELWAAIQDGRYREEGKLGHYIFQLAANNWRYELRKRRTRPTDDIENVPHQLADDSEESIERKIVKDRYLNAIQAALERIDSTCEQVIRLYHLQEKSLQDVAEQMKYDYNNLRKRIFDCRKKLKKITEEIMGVEA